MSEKNETAEKDLKEKQVARNKKSTSAVVKTTGVAAKTATNQDSKILEYLQSLNEKLTSNDAKLDVLSSRITDIEETVNRDVLPGTSFDYDFDNDSRCSDAKRPLENEVDPQSKFADMAKRFKGEDVVGPPLDETLAANINDLFRQGLEETQFEKLTDSIARPDNCQALTTVRCNKLIWKLCTPQIRHTDRTLQTVGTSLVKGSILIAQAASKIAELDFSGFQSGSESEYDIQGEANSVLDLCKDALALFGHCNQQMCMIRRNCIKPVISKEYSHLCNPAVPFTTELFGDDVSQTARELEYSAKIGNKIQGKREVYKGNYRLGKNKTFYTGQAKYAGKQQGRYTEKFSGYQTTRGSEPKKGVWRKDPK
ncbi:uncharacterized protein LOC106161898 isoform X2 [Lingula anatina]|uniref:Uncharacterized protein LOC106161898 isoform X2 n=1 Tax=Lingula anatina TaxID=7574 RepID=A0A1S3I831_LINAN|nr:uncharacterized protein LOC106161898 isoform X2 [Lingula anatina]|eukprot:XP_013394425.1 uncharacterized protein LOC106161898 isoform X2 [Lingula anatina]